MPKLSPSTPPSLGAKVTDNARLDLKGELQKRIIGQDHVLDEIVSVFYRWEIGLAPIGGTAGTFLLLGPTGTGKTASVEALSEVLFGNNKAFIKVDCAEYAHSHEIAKLLGSPPGYLGHRETSPVLTQENLNRHHTDKYKCSVVLFDEIEKASDSLWNLLLGILDKATLKLGDNRAVDFTNTFIFMTSNLGAREMQSELDGAYGFNSDTAPAATTQLKLDAIAIAAVKKRFTPEFVNRIDVQAVYHTLTHDNLRVILDQILEALQQRLIMSKGPKAFVLDVEDDAKELLLSKGISKLYGARSLKRAVEVNLSSPMIALMRSGDLDNTDVVRVSVVGGKCSFRRVRL